MKDIDSFQASDFELVGYTPHGLTLRAVLGGKGVVLREDRHGDGGLKGSSDVLKSREMSLEMGFGT